MKVAEMIILYDFHDSNVIKISSSDNQVEIAIDLCEWRQRWSQNTSSKITQVMLKFNIIGKLYWLSDKNISEIDYDTILDVKYNNGKIEIVLFDEDVSILSFECIDVDIVQ